MYDHNVHILISAVMHVLATKIPLSECKCWQSQDKIINHLNQDKNHKKFELRENMKIWIKIKFENMFENGIHIYTNIYM